ncbi:hypothetical protein MCNS_31900 [Mycobacterium conspicuum]|jgi:hypothetical protein|uniref:Uncharacterized protein n=2 Tax=Mycobacterium conspicuum TaxID=44010 RepID=A0A1X1TCP9_9MYCO|nr:hypothetical protein AWC00_12745 [Mycobacterium conspicuum]BBZ40127.1 hypothetical protein MCNS_31900 [Mycobacterium conspicuum]
MELPRSTFYDQLDKGTLITADNLCTAARNLGINRAELLTRYRFIDPEEIAALAEEIRGHSHRTYPPHVAPTSPEMALRTARKRPRLAELRPRPDAPPL